jgi:phage shock protein E
MQQENDDSNMIVIDVRTHGEFCRGHIEGSVNIPLNEIGDRIDEISAYNKAIMLCCASGVRSMQAYHLLSQYGIKKVYNGGSWSILQHQLNDIKQPG